MRAQSRINSARRVRGDGVTAMLSIFTRCRAIARH